MPNVSNVTMIDEEIQVRKREEQHSSKGQNKRALSKDVMISLDARVKSVEAFMASVDTPLNEIEQHFEGLEAEDNAYHEVVDMHRLRIM